MGLLCTHSDPTDARCASGDNGIVERPLPIAVVSLLDEADRFETRLHWTEELWEVIL